MKKLFLILLVFYNIGLFGQSDFIPATNYPVNYFNKPLNIPIVLAGTFGELRSNHFHTGLDLKTLQKEGLNVHSAAEGYVSRIKISAWGYGKALYITHPNGYTTVYAHLQKFNPTIEAFIKKKQYEKESFEIQVFPKKNELPISKNEIIAFSGSTGGFIGPHLHFEIRNTATEKPINPMLFGINVKDSKKPRINTLMGYSLSKNSQINGSNKPIQLSFKTLKNGDLRATKLTALGQISFGINAYDQLNGAANKNGLYSLQMLVNGTKQFEFKATSLAFSEGKYINLFIDYERYKNINQRIQKCFISPENKLSMLSSSKNKGVLTIEEGLNYQVEIIAKDFKGNIQKLKIPIEGKKAAIIDSTTKKITDYKIDKTIFHKFSKNGVSVAFPKYTFYKNLYLDFKVENNIAHIHTPTIPLNKSYTLTFDVANYADNIKKQLYIASINKKGKTSYVRTVKKEKTFYTSTKYLGDYTLKKDTIQPKVSAPNFKNEQWLTHFKTLKIKIVDTESGIKSYRGEIDGKWILMEYNVKTNLLTYNFNDLHFTKAKHLFKITVTDNVGNQTIKTTSFFRKK